MIQLPSNERFDFGLPGHLESGVINLLNAAGVAGFALDENGNQTFLTDELGNPHPASGFTAPVLRPNTLVSFGDSRANIMSTSGLALTGSATYINGQRGGWIAAYLGDTEYVGNFGFSGDITANWAVTSRSAAKSIQNLLAANGFTAGLPDACWIQYGINSYISSVTAASVTADLKALCATLMGAGIKVIFESTQPASAANYGASAAAKLQATLDGNAIMKEWLAQFPGKAVYVETVPYLIDGTGYLSTAISDGTHLFRPASMVAAKAVAIAARKILPAKAAMTYSIGDLARPNLMDWSASVTPAAFPDQGTFTFGTPVAGFDSATGAPYYEFTATVLTLNAGRALARCQMHANTIAGATPRHSLSVGDVLQGSAHVVIDDGAGGLAPIQAALLRHRAYFDTKFGDFEAFHGSATSNFLVNVDGRLVGNSFAIAAGSGAIAAPGSGAGYALEVFAEFNTVGQFARIRVYAPSLRVISSKAITQPAVGASPYTYTNTTGSDLTVYVGGGTVSAIGISRQGTVFTTGMIAGSFKLLKNDSIVITYTVAPTFTIEPI